MPWLPFYADRTDVQSVITYLNADNDCAFVVSNGPRQWKAVLNLESFVDGRYCIWVHGGGSLPLLRADGTEEQLIENPWRGWTEHRTGADSSQPYFGPGCPTVVWMNIHTKGREGDGIGVSSFGWIGNHYRVIDSSVPTAVERWWQRLRRRIKNVGKQIPRSGLLDGDDPEIWALPSALAAIKSGTLRDVNPI